MTLTLVTRSGNNLRQPRQVTRVTWASRTGITVHHTGAAFKTWRAVQDWSMDGKKYWDIDYNHGISGGRVHDLRGWLVRGAHDTVNTNLGVAFGGDYATDLPPAADLDALAAYVIEARRLSGRTLPVVLHRDIVNTSCPGAWLSHWIRKNLEDRLDGGLASAPSAPKLPAAGRPAPGDPIDFPLPPRHYFGPASGPPESVSGHYGREFRGRLDREWLQEWVRQLERRGWRIGPGGRYLTTHGNDGRYGPEHAELAMEFQKDQNLAVDAFIGPRTWNAAFRNPVT